MPPKKKKQPKNAFYFFMIDWKQEKEEQGQRFKGLAEVSELCSQDWKDLPEYNKEKYKMLEKQEKGQDKNDLSNKYNAQGISYQQIENEKLEKEAFGERMKSEIHNTLHRKKFNIEDLNSHHFFLVHANVYCYWGKEQKFLPSEVAISKFNLRDGLVDTYHVFPEPLTPDGKIPLGYQYQVQQNTDSVHDIPYPKPLPPQGYPSSEPDLVERDWGKISADIRKFLLPHGGKSTDMPPLFTIDADDTNINCHVSAVKTFFDHLSGISGDEFRVYSLTLMFFELYAACQELAERLFGDNEKAFPVEGVAHAQLVSDVYNFSHGITCEFHEDKEHFHNCSLSFVKRWIFHICEFCCKALQIELIPGRHCLANAKISTYHEVPIQNRSTQSVGSKVGCDSDDDGSWHKVEHGMKKLSVDSRRPSSGTSERQQISSAWGTGSKARQDERAAGRAEKPDLVIIDHSQVLDTDEMRVYKTGQSSRVVSEIMPSPGEASVRRPVSLGRGESLARALSLQQSSSRAPLSEEDFPSIGAGRPGRLAKPITTGWGRGILRQ